MARSSGISKCWIRQPKLKMAGAMSWMVELHIGVHNEACWTGFHMPLQFEDVVDCLNVGDVQSMVFKPTDSGQWHLKTEERKACRHDTPTGKIKTVERTKRKLVDELTAAGVSLQKTATIPGNSCKNSKQTMVSPFVSTRGKSSKAGRESPKAFSKSSGRGASLMKASRLIVTRSMAGKIRSRARSTANCRSGI
jgi:hypothetical protein